MWRQEFFICCLNCCLMHEFFLCCLSCCLMHEAGQEAVLHTGRDPAGLQHRACRCLLGAGAGVHLQAVQQQAFICAMPGTVTCWNCCRLSCCVLGLVKGMRRGSRRSVKIQGAAPLKCSGSLEPVGA